MLYAPNSTIYNFTLQYQFSGWANLWLNYWGVTAFDLHRILRKINFAYFRTAEGAERISFVFIRFALIII